VICEQRRKQPAERIGLGAGQPKNRRISEECLLRSEREVHGIDPEPHTLIGNTCVGSVCCCRKWQRVIMDRE
jgi:hypothetical protein